MALGLIAAIFIGQGSSLGFLFLVIVLLGLVTLVIVLTTGVVLALRGLYRQPELRTQGNVAIAVAGLAVLALVLYLLVSTATEKGVL